MLKQHEKINNLTILKFVGCDKRHRKIYLCRCICGVEKTILGSAVKNGGTKSCGCLAKAARQVTRLPDNKAVINQIILGYKRHAKDRNLLWEIDFDEVNRLIKSPCHYCNIPPSNNKITKNCIGFKYSGIDRLDSSLGYTINNVVSSCNQCNKLKMALSKTDFLEWIIRIYNHQKAIGNIEQREQAMAEQWGK